MLRLVIVITTVLISIHSYSQISFGPKAGINIATWTTEGSNTITGFQGGVVAQFQFNEEWSVQPELLIDNKGVDLANFIPNNPMRYTLSYLTLPVVLGYKVRGITFRAGAYSSALLKSGIEINSRELDEEEIDDSFFEDWDWGLTAGATLDITPGLGFEVLYYFGFPDVVDITFGDTNGQFLAHLNEGKNRVLQLGMYYKFNSE
ncbi:MAG TPA: porin family protein [Saprospiraceae bacterium]|nr:porin family protein [Saprospiraceae bacterium]